MATKTKKLPEIKSITGLRGICALFVFLFHTRGITSPEVLVYPLIDFLVKTGDFGVDVFFILSGFILSAVYVNRETTIRNFLTYRIARMWPVHILTMLVMLGVYIIGKEKFGYTPQSGASVYSLPSILANVFMIQEWLDPSDVFVRIIPGLSELSSRFWPIGSPNGVAWSISCEFLAYCFFPVLLSKFKGFKEWKLLTVISISVGILALRHIWFPGNILRISALFPAGMAFYFLREKIPTLTGLYGLCVIGSLYLMPYNFTFYFAAAISTGLFIASIFSETEQSGTSKFLSIAPIHWLGEISYSVYLIHWPVWCISKNLIAIKFPLLAHHLWSVMALNLIVTLILAHYTYRYIETPMRGLVIRRFSAK